MNTETFDNPADFLAALKGKQRQRKTSALSRERSERTGLTSLLLAGWCNEYNAAMGMRLYRNGVSTQFYDDEKAACAAARLLAEQEE